MSSVRRKRSETPRETSMDFEDLLEAVGGYGKYQRRLIWCFLVPASMVIPFLVMNQIFMMSTPSHSCYEPNVSASEDLPADDKLLLIRPQSEQAHAPQPYDSCRMYNVSYFDVLRDLRLSEMNVSYFVETHSPNWSTVACQNGWDYDKTLYHRTATSDWDLVCDHNYFPSLVFTLGTVGSAIGTPIFGAVSDRVGRKVSFFAASIIGVISAVLTVTVPSLMAFLVVRTFNGSLLPSVFQLPYLIVVEIVSPEARTRANGVTCIGWTVGLCLMPLVAWLTADWVWFGWVSAICSVPFVAYYWILPESPRWLICRDRFDEAGAVFQKIAKVNGKDVSNLDMISLLKKCAHKEKSETEETRSSPLEFLRKPTLLRRFFFLTVIWTVDSMSYYGFHMNVSALYGNEFLNFFLLALVEFPSYMLTWYMMGSKLGRRWTHVIFLFMSAIACILPVTKVEVSPTLTTVAALVGKFGVAASFMVMYQQSAEVFPTPLRASGMGLAGTIANLISISTPYIIYLSKYGQHIPFTVIGLLCFSAGVCAIFIPETLNENLPQTVDDGENFGKGRPFFSLANKKSPEKKYDARKGSFRGMSNELEQISNHEQNV